MNNKSINSIMRNEIGSNACNRIRNIGFIPSVIYGHNFINHTLKFSKKDIKDVIRNFGENAIVEVAIENTSFPAIIKEVQRDSLTNEIIHLDLQKIDIGEKITTSIPILIAGRKSLDSDHILQQQLQKIEVECYPNQVPDNVLVDISQMAMNKSYKVGDVELGEDITILTNTEEIIASITRAKNNEEIEDDEYDYGIEESKQVDIENNIDDNKDDKDI
ncbi:50S ribosomal protein L25 [Clostridiaceae bacterium M8S5]|nr:50S ribosomal protein L25 [Clostridiaceae bacterium M8S5]